MIYEQLATPEQTAEFADKFKHGISYGEAKAILYDKFVEFFAAPRAKYEDLKAHPDTVYDILAQGAKEIRPIAQEGIQIIRQKIGIGR